MTKEWCWIIWKLDNIQNFPANVGRGNAKEDVCWIFQKLINNKSLLSQKLNLLKMKKDSLIIFGSMKVILKYISVFET